MSATEPGGDALPGPSSPPASSRAESLRAWLVARDRAALVALQLLVALVVLATGFRAVSDDDYARVVIAQELVAEPKLDPSGTSWLPLPFWIQGAAMAIFGRSLEVARAVAVVTSLGCALVLREAALLLGGRRDAALLGSALAICLPWTARLSVATVPELLVASLGLYALATLGPSVTARQRMFGALALFAATLARYEPWVLAGLFALLALRDARRARLDERPAREGLTHLGSALVAVAGPAAWSAWNAHAHGSALHYVHRVAAYRQAVDGGKLVARALEYPLATLRAEPELLVLFAIVLLRWWPDRQERRALSGFLQPALVLLAFVLVLVGLGVRGGAPTHHPERALLIVHLYLAVLTARLGLEALREGRLGRRVVLPVFALLVLAMPPLRMFWLYKERFADRSAEIAIGRVVAERCPAGALVLLETIDYGYFAIQAASGRPESVKPEGRVDPVHGGTPMLPHALAIRARLRGAEYVVSREPKRPEEQARAEAYGLELLERREGWVLWRIGEPRT